MKYAGVIKNDVVNGYDVCVSYWCQGCRFRCPGCHNPQTWDFDGGTEIEESALIKMIINSISQNNVQRNLSILGGEPLCRENVNFTSKLIKNVVETYPDIKIFVWTGYKYEYLLEIAKENYYMDHVLSNIHVLIDGQFEIDNRDISLPFRGSKNQRVIDIQKSIKAGKIILYCE